MVATLSLSLSNENSLLLRPDNKVALVGTGADLDNVEFKKDKGKYFKELTTSLGGVRKLTYSIIEELKNALLSAGYDSSYKLALYNYNPYILLFEVLNINGNIVFRTVKGTVVLNKNLGVESYTDKDILDFLLVTLNRGTKEFKKEETMQDKLRRVYKDDFVEREQYLLQYFKRIHYNESSIKRAYDLLFYVCESHKQLSTILNLSIYPKLDALILTSENKSNSGSYCNNRITIRTVCDSTPLEYLAILSHEYGHYIHEHLEKIHEGNKKVFLDMVSTIFKMPTMRILRMTKLTPEKLKYYIDSSEVVARLFESYALYEFIKKGIIQDLSWYGEQGDYLLFKDAELDMFKRYMTQLQLR